MTSRRPAGKEGQWYQRGEKAVRGQLDAYLAQVPHSIDGSLLPIPNARMIIAPHAGYDYSGQCAAWAYSCLDLHQVKRVFLLGPSHTYYLQGGAVTTYAQYATPLGNLTVDRETIQQVKVAGDMDDIPRARDDDEHSLEMHLPYLYRICELTFESSGNFPVIVPILVGDSDRAEEKALGKVLLPYLKDPTNAFIISSDFCHWGHHFRYMVYSAENDASKLVSLSRMDPPPAGPPIHETIRMLDELAMNAVANGKHDAFYDNLKQTKNTVCGRHPIGVAVAALELNAAEATDGAGHRFRVVKYDRSNLVLRPRDYSVSYVSAYAIL